MKLPGECRQNIQIYNCPVLSCPARTVKPTPCLPQKVACLLWRYKYPATSSTRLFLRSGRFDCPALTLEERVPSSEFWGMLCLCSKACVLHLPRWEVNQFIVRWKEDKSGQLRNICLSSTNRDINEPVLEQSCRHEERLHKKRVSQQ